RRGPGRHVSQAGDDRRPGVRRRGARDLAGHQPGGRDERRAARPLRGPGSRRRGRGADGPPAARPAGTPVTDTPEADLFAAARTWLAEDPDPVTRAELTGLLEAGDVAAIGDRFSS